MSVKICCHRIYWCPTVKEVECRKHGGFETCCISPEKHKPMPLRFKVWFISRTLFGNFMFLIAFLLFMPLGLFLRYTPVVFAWAREPLGDFCFRFAEILEEIPGTQR